MHPCMGSGCFPLFSILSVCPIVIPLPSLGSSRCPPTSCTTRGSTASLSASPGEDAVFSVWPHLDEQFLAEATGILDYFWIGCLSLEQDDLLPLGRSCDRIVDLFQRNDSPIHHELDLGQNQKPSDEQEDLFLWPPAGSLGVALLDQLAQDDLSVVFGAEIEMTPQILYGLRVVFPCLEQQVLLSGDLSAQRRAGAGRAAGSEKWDCTKSHRPLILRTTAV